MKYILALSLFAISTLNYAQTASSLTEVNFEFDSFKLTKRAKKVIMNELISFNETTQIKLIGFTDTIGSLAYNLKLSTQRCEAVKKYLIDNGIKEESIVKMNGEGERDEHELLGRNRAVKISSITSVLTNNRLEVNVNERKIDSVKSIRKSEVVVKNEVKTLSKELSEVSVGKTINIKGLNFIPGRHILLPSSEPKLYELLDILQNNPTLKIEIQGHICCSRDGLDGYDIDTDSKRLSLNRAINIYEYLVKQGIDKDRLSYVGFGRTRPLVEEVDDRTRQMNRRVEVKIIEK